MKKFVSIMFGALALVFIAAPAQAAAPEECSTETAPGVTCVMPAEGNIVDNWIALVAALNERAIVVANDLNATVADMNQQIADRDAKLAAYHAKVEVLGGRIEGYKDQIRWQRHEIRRLRTLIR